MRSSRCFGSRPVDRPLAGELEAPGGGPGRAVERAGPRYVEPTWLAALLSVESIVVMTFWPDSKARSEAIMSVIARVGSAPEPSSAPERTSPVPRPPAVPVKRLSPALRGVGDGEDADAGRGDLAVGADRDRLAVLAEDGVAELVDEAAVGGGGELAVARVAHALRRSGRRRSRRRRSRSRGRLAGLRSGCGGEVGDLARRSGRRCRAARRSGRSGCSAGAGRRSCPGRAVGLVARRRGVGEVVRDQVLARHLGDHARRGDVEPAFHVTFIGPAA